MALKRKLKLIQKIVLFLLFLFVSFGLSVINKVKGSRIGTNKTEAGCWSYTYVPPPDCNCDCDCNCTDCANCVGDGE
jgi:hypothetical protein